MRDLVPSHARRAVAVIYVVIIVAVIVIVAVAGAYYALTSATSTPGTMTGTSSSTVNTSPPLSTTTSSGTIHTTSTGGSTSASGAEYFTGTYNFTVPEGPSGVRSLSNGSAQYYNTVQFGQGTFSFVYFPGNYSGFGTGKGTLTITTTGFCTAQMNVPYTFKIDDVTFEIVPNATIFFAEQIPQNITVPLSCTGDMTGVSTATNEPLLYLPTYPNELSISANITTEQVTQVGNPGGGIHYYFDVGPKANL